MPVDVGRLFELDLHGRLQFTAFAKRDRTFYDAVMMDPSYTGPKMEARESTGDALAGLQIRRKPAQESQARRAAERQAAEAAAACAAAEATVQKLLAKIQRLESSDD